MSFQENNEDCSFIHTSIKHNPISIQSFLNTISMLNETTTTHNIKAKLFLEINTVGHMLFTSENLPAAENLHKHSNCPCAILTAMNNA